MVQEVSLGSKDDEKLENSLRFIEAQPPNKDAARRRTVSVSQSTESEVKKR